MRVAIQLVTYHGSKDLPSLLQSLKRQTVTDWKLFVCENSCDRTEAGRVQSALEAADIPHHLIISPSNIGFTAHNILFRMHDASYAFFLNDDACLEEQYLEDCLQCMDVDPDCAAVTGLVYRSPADRIIDTAGLDYDCLGHVVDRCAGERRVIISPQKIFGVSCVAALFRRSAVEAVSPEQLPFNPDFFMYKEDVDLAIRLRRKGFTAWLEPSAVAFHKRGIKASGNTWTSRVKDERGRAVKLREQMYRNQWAIYVYHFSFRLGARDILCTVWHELKRSATLFVFGSPLVFWRAWSRMLRDFPRARQRRQKLRALGLSSQRFSR